MPNDEAPSTYQFKEEDRDLVLNLASIHCTLPEIAAVVGCAVSTLRARFKDELARGRDRGKASLRRRQWELAQQGDRGMLIWLGKNWLGQTDQLRLDWRSELAKVLGVDVEALPDKLDGHEVAALPGPDAVDAEVVDEDGSGEASRGEANEKPGKRGEDADNGAE
jgi:hypothetical protein